MAPMTERFEMRLDEDILERVDQWREAQEDVLSRAEAMRRLVEVGLARTGSETKAVRFSDGEKALLIMMRDLLQHLDVESECDPQFLAKVIYGGHYWAPTWDMQGLFHGDEDDSDDVHFVVEVLVMWDQIERSYTRLSPQDKELIEKEADPFGRNVSFAGFDGNNETGLMAIARFLVQDMGRFQEFAGRELNSHMPTVDVYRRMLSVFAPMKKSLMGSGLTAAQIVRILKAKRYRE
jgi:uncharacterized protein YfbU (UPF0304 family)